MTGPSTFLLSLLGCLWYYGTNVYGEPAKVNDGGPEAYIRRLTNDAEHLRIRDDENPLPDPGPEADFKLRSDYAATLVHRGDVKKAVEILEDIERRKPGEYVVAANLGTAYELSGNNDKALEWIRECLRRNKESHYGSEWLHIKILEAKIALSKDPAWLRTHTVLGVDFGMEAVPSRPAKWTGDLAQRNVSGSIAYQLRERMAFVKAPDPVVGDLLVDLGNLTALEMTIEHAIAVYGLALTYQPVHADLVMKRREHLQGVLADRRRRDLLKNLLFYAGGAVGVLGLGVFWTRVRRASGQK